MTARLDTLSAAPARTPGVWGRRLRVFWRGWEMRVCTVFLLLLVGVAVIPVSAWGLSPDKADLMLRHERPAFAGGEGGFVLGTDALGRDVLARIIAGTRLTLLISSLATLLATVAGTAAGLLAGYYRGKVDAAISRLVDLMLAFPILLLILALVAALGPSLTSLILVLALSGWAGYVRVIRSAALTLGSREFVEAARCLGATSAQIIGRHLLPNVASPVLVLSTLHLASFILTESAVSFLGLGPQPPDVTWGGLIGDGRNYITDAWWVTLGPGLAIILTVLAFNLVGDALRDAFDPYSVGRTSD